MSGNVSVWMDASMASFSTVFQSHLDDERMVMKCCFITPFTNENISASGMVMVTLLGLLSSP